MMLHYMATLFLNVSRGTLSPFFFPDANSLGRGREAAFLLALLGMNLATPMCETGATPHCPSPDRSVTLESIRNNLLLPVRPGLPGAASTTPT